MDLCVPARSSVKKFLLLMALAALSTGCRGKAPESFIGPKLELLFVGNSYTFVNDLPRMVAQLAASGHHQLSTDLVAPGGWTLAQHSNSKETLEKIAGKKWDFIVLQDQSVMPSLEQQRNLEMYPAIRFLNVKILQAGAKPLLYMTWGRQKGMTEVGFNDYESMQAQLTLGYTGIAKELGLRVAPVGEAWKAALGQDPALSLWQADGSHPTTEGTYLAACVFYSVLYKERPVGLDFTAGLPKGAARALQAASAETVLAEPGRWNIP